MTAVHIALGLWAHYRFILRARSCRRDANADVAGVGLALDGARGFAFGVDALLVVAEIRVPCLTLGSLEATAWCALRITCSHAVADTRALFAGPWLANDTAFASKSRVVTSGFGVAGIRGTSVAVVAVHGLGRRGTTQVFAVTCIIDGASVSIVTKECANRIARAKKISVFLYVLGDCVLADVDRVPVGGIAGWEMADLNFGRGSCRGWRGQQGGSGKERARR